MTNAISNSNTTVPTPATTTPSANATSNAAATNAASTANNAADVQDKLELTTEESKAADSAKKTYSEKKASRNMVIDQLKSEAESKISQFKNLVEKLVVKQGGKGAVGAWDGISPLKDYLQQAFSGGVDANAIAQAQKDVAEGGYWSVESTGDRILEFAKALIGDDMGNFEKIKKAVIAGFGDAQSVWGKEKMPDITKKTYDYVMSKFDEWEKAGSTTAAMGAAEK